MDDVVGRRANFDRAHADGSHLAVVTIDADPVAWPIGALNDRDDSCDQAADIVFEREANREAQSACNDQKVLQGDVEDDRGHPGNRNHQHHQTDDRNTTEQV